MQNPHTRKFSCRKLGCGVVESRSQCVCGRCSLPSPASTWTLMAAWDSTPCGNSILGTSAIKSPYQHRAYQIDNQTSLIDCLSSTGPTTLLRSRKLSHRFSFLSILCPNLALYWDLSPSLRPPAIVTATCVRFLLDNVLGLDHWVLG